MKCEIALLQTLSFHYAVPVIKEVFRGWQMLPVGGGGGDGGRHILSNVWSFVCLSLLLCQDQSPSELAPVGVRDTVSVVL